MSRQGCLQKTKEALLKLDFFCATQFLRYKSESEYATFTGAFCSIVIVVSFLAIFMNVLISTINRTTITYNMSTIDESNNPLTLNTGIQNDNKFMFALGIGGFDLNHPLERYFDVTLTLVSSLNKVKTKTRVVLQTCQIQKWNISNDITGTYSRMGFDELLCVPQNIEMSLQGKFSESIFNYAQLEINKCNTTLNPARPCANDTYMLSKLSGNSFYTNFYFINSLINPNNEQPVSYYLEDRNYIQFNFNTGGLINLFISKYSVTTDKSIWPLQDTYLYEGGYSRDLGQFISFQNDGNTLAQFFIRRASSNVEVTRMYTKLDYTLSYIGGLFGFIMAALYFMTKYTQCCYQIDAGAQLYKQEHNKEIDKQAFNIFWYLGYLLYWMLGSLGCQVEWERMKRYDQCRDEIAKQFDVCFLFERINFFESSLKLLFSDEQYKLLHLQRRLTLRDAVQLRENYENLARLKDHPEEALDKTHQQMMEHTQEDFQFNQRSPGIKQHKRNGHPLEDDLSPKLSLFKKGMKMLKKESLKGDSISKKIIQNVDQNVAAKIEECPSESSPSELPQQKEIKEPQNESHNGNMDTKAVIEAMGGDVIKIKPVEAEEPFAFL